MSEEKAGGAPPDVGGGGFAAVAPPPPGGYLQVPTSEPPHATAASALAAMPEAPPPYGQEPPQQQQGQFSSVIVCGSARSEKAIGNALHCSDRPSVRAAPAPAAATEGGGDRSSVRVGPGAAPVPLLPGHGADDRPRQPHRRGLRGRMHPLRAGVRRRRRRT